MEYCPYCMRRTTGPVCEHCHKELTCRNDKSQLPAGTVLQSGGHTYLLGAALGQGGFGITYIALDQTTGERCAVKECFPVMCCQRGSGGRVESRPGYEKVSAGAVESFLKEIEMLRSIRDVPSVVRYLDSFTQNGTAYLVMEYLDGISLKKKLAAEGPIPAPLLLEKLPALLRDMEILHRNGVIHRDIAPDNIMWMPDDTLKLLDFGCARNMEEGKSMTVQLKHGFAPVEQYMTRGQGPWTDVYALSASIYYCLTGVVPPMSPERLEEDVIQPLSALGVRMEPGQEEALLWGLTVQPKQRPVSVEIFARHLFGQPGPTPPEQIPSPAEPVKKRFSLLRPFTTREIILFAAAALAILALSLTLLSTML